jgi:hypothetical protein
MDRMFKRFDRNIFTLLCFLALALPVCAAESGTDRTRDQSGIREKCGVEIQGIYLSAAGYMLDFRYRVIDPDKATAFFDIRQKPYLIDDSSGAVFAVPKPPKVGSLRATVRSGKPIPGRTYFIFFANPGRYVKAGSTVTVVIGDLRLENLKVN